MRKKRDSNGGDGWGGVAIVAIMIILALAFLRGTKDYGVLPIIPDTSLEGEIEVEIVPHEGEAVPGLLICFERQGGYILWKLNVPARDGIYASQMSIDNMNEEKDMVVGLIDTGDNKLVSLYHLNGTRLISEGYLKNKEIEWHLEGDVLRDVEIFLHTAAH